MADRFRILVADDHPLYRSALVELLARTDDFELIGAVDGLLPAVALMEQKACDLAIVDLGMPGMEGVGSVRLLRDKRPEAKIAVISGALSGAVVADGLAAGIRGFLPKSFEHDVILAAIRLILAGGIYVPHDLAPAASASSEAVGGLNGSPLSVRELQILQRMVNGDRHKEIGRALGIAEVTVKLHTQRIVRKLGVKNRAAAIAKAVKERLIAY